MPGARVKHDPGRAVALDAPVALPPETRGSEHVVLAPLVSQGPGFAALVLGLLAVIGVGLVGWTLQLRDGLTATGLSDRVQWGVYITSFVFFIGISHAGTLISAILRVTGTEWRRPITRVAEAITVFALLVGAPFVIFDLGRPERFWYLIVHGRFESPILWDFVSILTYLTGSVIYLYLPMIPDLALCRDRLDGIPVWQRRMYRALSLGWSGTPRQVELLERAIGVMAVVIIPVAISVHTVVSWIFGMTLRTGWHSSIFGPYFVIGAIFSGVATLLIALYVCRQAFGLEAFITRVHFRNLGLLLLVLDLLYFYFSLSEYLTAGYGGELADAALLDRLLTGDYAGAFWFFVLGGLVVPAVILAFPRTATIGGIVAASVLVDVGLWVKRYVIVVPTLALPQVAGEWAAYRPTWVEWSILAAAVAAFVLLYALFARFFPLVSLWEMRAEDGRGGGDG